MVGSRKLAHQLSSHLSEAVSIPLGHVTREVETLRDTEPADSPARDPLRIAARLLREALAAVDVARETLADLPRAP